MAVGDNVGHIEIWDVDKKEAIKKVEIGSDGMISASASIHNILAVGSTDKKLRLYDVRNWECFWSQEYNAEGYSLHLTENLKYLTYAGWGGDRCFVLEIE